MRRSLLVSLVLLLAPGCSFWAVRGPDPLVPGGGDCTTSAAVPAVDGVLAAGFVGLGSAGLVSSAKPDPWGMNKAVQAVGIGLLAVGVVQTAATVAGGARVSSCRDAKKHGPPPGATPVRPAPDLRLGVESGS